jgi:hypothetical protein
MLDLPDPALVHQRLRLLHPRQVVPAVADEQMEVLPLGDLDLGLGYENHTSFPGTEWCYSDGFDD